MIPKFRATWRFVVLLAGLSTSALSAGEVDYDWPLGPIGGTFRPWSGEKFVRVTDVATGAPGAAAGLQVDDFIYGAFGEEFAPLGSDFTGLVQDLGAAIERAEAGDGLLPLMVLRPGTGGLNINVALPALGAIGPAYPLGSAKFSTVYENACADLHQRVMNDSDGNLGHPTGFIGLALLGHPNWADTTGAKPYRLSINKIRDYCVTLINNAEYAPVENKLLDDPLTPSDNPAYQSTGLENWSLGLAVMFLSEYRTKAADATVADDVQLGAEIMANRIQWWKQPAKHSNGYSPGYNEIAGMVGHGGVTGDYIHLGWGGGINMTGVHIFGGLALAKRAGADMTVRPRDGHYFGYDIHDPDPWPAAIAGAVPSGMEYYDHTLAEKFQMAWDWLVRSSKKTPGNINDGAIGYNQSQGGSPYDAGGRTPASLFGMTAYHDGWPADPNDADYAQRQAGYITRNYMRHLNAHAYNIGGSAFQQLALNTLDGRSRRYFLENWKFFYTLSRQPDGSAAYFRGRSFGDAYQNLDLMALTNAALPGSVARGGLPHVPTYPDDHLIADFQAPVLKWPSLAARTFETGAAINEFQVEITDVQGNVLNPSSYTATWSVVSGPATDAIFSSTSSATTTVTFPQSGTYTIQLTATDGTRSVTEPIEANVHIGTLPADWTWGKADYEVYTGITGNSVPDLTDSAKFIAGQPDITGTLNSIEGTYGGSNYGARITGCIVPSQSGSYTFRISSDDTSEFRLNSSGSDPAGATLLASVSGWTDQYQWDKYSGQTSPAISLTAGVPYYYEVLHKEGTGGDHVAVAWSGPGITGIEVIGAAFIAKPPSFSATPTIVQQPQDQSVALGETATFAIVTDGPEPATYQWRLDGVALWPPSTEPTLTLDNVGAGLTGDYDCIYTTPAGTTTSTTAHLTVTGTGDLASGGLWRDVFTGISGNSVSDLTNDYGFPRLADASGSIPTPESPSDYANNYGERWTGWITPSETGNHIFYIASDDSSELWLSTTNQPADKVKIAYKSGWTGVRNWSGGGASAAIPLIAGTRYYIEVLHKEGGGGDNCAVTWKRPSDPGRPANGTEPMPGAVLEHLVGGVFTDTVSLNDPPSIAIDNPRVTSAAIPPDTGVVLESTVTDDSASSPGPVTTTWSKQSGPGTVSFADASVEDTTATFGAPGTYVLRVTVDDGEYNAHAEVIIDVTTTSAGNLGALVDAGPDGTYNPSDTLAGSVSDDGLPDPPAAPTVGWSQVSGPGTATFTDATDPTTDVNFPVLGTYVLRLSADDGEVVTFDDVTANMANQPTPFEQWQNSAFGTNAGNPAIAGESADPDRDGIANLMEYALNLDPNARLTDSGLPGHNGLPAVDTDGADLALIYRRNLSATDVTFIIEESDDLGLTDPWSPTTVTETILSDDGQTQVIRAAVLKGSAPRKFLRLKVT